MSIRTVRGELLCECDECGAEAWGGCQDSFRAFVEELKEQGWKPVKTDDGWEHLCPSCADN